MINQRKIHRKIQLACGFLLIFAGSMAAYLLVIMQMDGFYENLSQSDYYENVVHVLINSMAFPAIFTLLLLLKRGYILSNIVLKIFLLALLTNSIYYGYFDAPVELAQWSQASALPLVGRQIVQQLITWRELFVLLCGATVWLSGTLIIRRHRELDDASTSFARPIRIACSGLLVLWVFHGAAMAYMNNPFAVRSKDSIQLIKQLGFTGFYSTELYMMVFDRPVIPDFPGRIYTQISSDRDYEGVDKLNIIFLQVESLDSAAVEMKIGGQPLLANLNELKETSLYFPHFMAQHRGGASQDSEFSSLLSLIPANGRSGFNSCDLDTVRSLADVLNEQGYTSVGYHGNTGAFFNREKRFRQSGFEDFKDSDDYKGKASGWRSNDASFLTQTADYLVSLEAPFFAYIITMQSHGPFDNYTALSRSLNLSDYPTKIQQYLRSMYEVDYAIGKFFENLEEQGMLEDTIVVVFSDHASGLKDASYVSSKHQPPLPEHIPLFIRFPDGRTGIKKTVGSQIDLGPTILDVLDFTPPELWLGTSLLSGNTATVVLNYPVPKVFKSDEHGKVSSEIDIEQYRKYVRWSEALQGK